MRGLRVHKWKQMIGALAILGALLNAWALAIHTASAASIELRAKADGIIICHRGGFVTVADLDGGGSKPPTKKRCPICSGAASLHVGVLDEPALLTPVPAGASDVVAGFESAAALDRRLQRILNRGPPRLS